MRIERFMKRKFTKKINISAPTEPEFAAVCVFLQSRL